MLLFIHFKKYLKYRKFFLLLVLFFLGILEVNAVSNPYNKNFNGQINCTWFAWQQAYDKAGVALPGWGNANTWFESAKKAGYETGMTPKVNSIVVWKWSSFGHVGYVERVYGDSIYVWDSVHPDGCPAEMPDLYNCWDKHTLEEVDNGACDGVSTAPHGCYSHATYWHNPGDLIGYIYLDNAPKKPVSSGTSNQNKVTPASVKKSNNANLSNIKIDNIEFEFKKDILEYNLEVKNNVEKINIDATTEHNKAKVEGSGEQNLAIGDNTIELVVTAEDGTKQTYIIKIKRKDNNAYLNNFTISNIDFAFAKDTFKYEIEIARDIETITIDGTPETETSKVEGLGIYELSEEETIINIIVTAEDETTKTYTITLKKEPIIEKTISKKKNDIWPIIVITIIVLIIIIVIITYIIKKRKSEKNEKNI
ncbi:MAG TPA: hypothetical protein DCE23_07535 [Firmicutes bacterium]|nr:hypothetical protein [Bacillota bacterium]